MAVTVINLSDPVSTWVTKTNTIASNLGDLATLSTSATSDLVAAINEVNGLVDGNLNDSAEIKGLFASSTDIQFDSASGTFSLGGSGGGVRAFFQTSSTISFDSASGMFNIVANSVDSSHYGDSSIAFEHIQGGAIKSANFNGMQTLQLINAAGTTVKTMYSPGS